MPALARRRPPPVDKLSTTRDNLRKLLLSWYDQNGREMPWRVRNGRADAYRVWLSEVMLQQTTVAAVGPYFSRFLERWPDVAALAAAPRDDLLGAWAGLGYYSRARNLHAAAQLLAANGLPQDEAGWRALPGVGAYTAAAIAAIALDQPANVVDGNVERVMARLYAVEAPLPQAKAELRERAGALVTAQRPGDWAQALMDLGATLCTPKAPKCDACPWRKACAAYAGGAPESYPRRAAKAERPQRYGVAYRIEREGALWLVRRPDAGLLGGMAALPTTEWRGKKWTRAEALQQAPAEAGWKKVGAVAHVFTHFALALDVYAADAEPSGEGWWGEANVLPTVFKKAAHTGRKG
ncbi:MAG: A/G-specific adenine glycosylase [Hyphomonadaceae bacterium]|nr:A/G-specific adenine glycosylase [Hyphomonadaceae bacterium]